MTNLKHYITLIVVLSTSHIGYTQVNQQSSNIIVKSTTEENIWTRKLLLKTNVLELGLAIANIGIEIDVAKHWSFTLPVSYSCWDYFKATRKFRIIDIRPELRYWPSRNNDGFFTGLHYGIIHYNLAFDTEYRYQNQENTPDQGGGISIGFRHPVGKNNRWRIEYLIGAGVYQLNFNKYNNTPDSKNGMMIETVEKEYIGIDKAAISFSYTFGLNKNRNN